MNRLEEFSRDVSEDAPTRGADRRLCRRLPIPNSGLIIPAMIGDSGGILLDASDSGLMVQSLAALSVGETVRIQITDSGATLSADAQVVWTNAGGQAGLRFAVVPEDWWVRIRELATEHDILPTPDPAEAECPHLAACDTDAAKTMAKQVCNQVVFAQTPGHFADFVEQALSICEADGAALALESEGIVRCVQSAGVAPSVGAKLNLDAGISGECYRVLRPVICEDAEHDPRVNPEIARETQLHSILVVPVLHEGKPIGLLQVLSRKRSAFGDVHAELLAYIAERIVAIRAHVVAPEPKKTRDADSATVVRDAPANVATERAAVTDRVADTDTARPVVPKPISASAAKKPTNSAIKTEAAFKSGPTPSQPKPATPRPAPEHIAAVPTFASVSDARPGWLKWAMIALLCVVIAVVGWWVYQSMFASGVAFATPSRGIYALQRLPAPQGASHVRFCNPIT